MQETKRCGFNPLVGKIPWGNAWQPTPVFLPGEAPWTEEPGGLQSIGSQRVDTTKATKHSIFQCMARLDFIYALWCILEVSGSQCVIPPLPVNNRGRSSWKHKVPWFGALFPTANPWLTCAWNMHSSYLYEENLIIHEALIPRAMWDYPLRSTSLLFFIFFGHASQGDNPMPPAVEVRSFNHWTTREFPTSL